jgi:hypothetical protein
MAGKRGAAHLDGRKINENKAESFAGSPVDKSMCELGGQRRVDAMTESLRLRV